MRSMSTASGGAKQHGLKVSFLETFFFEHHQNFQLRHKQTQKITYELKLRGIYQNLEADQALPYETFKADILNFGKNDAKQLWQHVFRPSIYQGKVHTMDVLKT